jgi:hypothetical protein
MPDQKDKFLETLLQINFALISGLESAILFMENVDATDKKQRNEFIDKTRRLTDMSRNALTQKQKVH